MNTQPITINVDAEPATAYRSSSEEERRKMTTGVFRASA